MTAADAELLRPTLHDHRPRDWATGLPWRVSSQVYVALLGGPLAVTPIAAINARRLRMPPAAMAVIVVTGLVALVAGVAAAVLIPGDAPRLLLGLAGVAAYGVFHLLQRSPDRVHSAFSPHDDEEQDYASLWGPGLVAVIAGVAVQLAIVRALE